MKLAERQKQERRIEREERRQFYEESRKCLKQIEMSESEEENGDGEERIVRKYGGGKAEQGSDSACDGEGDGDGEVGKDEVEKAVVTTVVAPLDAPARLPPLDEIVAGNSNKNMEDKGESNNAQQQSQPKKAKLA